MTKNGNELFFPGNILILTGPPGAGKTTTASSLAEISGGPAVHLHSDDFWHFIRKGYVPPYLPASRRQNEVVMNVIAAAAETYARGQYFVILDGIVGPWFLSAFKQVQAPLHYIVLRPASEVSVFRAQNRGGNQLVDAEVIGDLHRQFTGLGDLEQHVIETTAHEPAETLQAVQARLSDGSARLRIADLKNQAGNPA